MISRYYKERKFKLKLRKLGVNLEDADGIDFQDLKGQSIIILLLIYLIS